MDLDPAPPDVEVSASLSELELSSVSQADKATQFSNILHKILTSSSAEKLTQNLQAFVDSVLADSVGIVASRPILGEFVERVKEIQDPRIKKEICVYTTEKLRPRIVSFEEQDSSLRQTLADVYEAEENWEEAARTLQGITLESSQRMISNEFRLETYIRIMRLLLEDDNFVTADTFLNKATHLIHKSSDFVRGLQFQLCQARILDAKRQFLNACSRYHQLSFSPLVAEEDRLACLSAGIICAVLAPAGPQRSRSLATLYKDDRSPQLGADYAMLEKMYLDRLLSPREVEEFSKRLKPHHLATMADGSTVLSKAVIEHNLLASSRLYNNIGVDELGVLLGLPPEKAQEYAARMIEQRRLSGKIDQIDRLICFDSSGGAAAVVTDGEGGSSGVGRHSDAIVRKHLRKWDDRIAALAQEVESCTSMLQTVAPEFVAKHLHV